MEIPFAGQLTKEDWGRVVLERLLPRRTKLAAAALAGFLAVLLVGSFFALAKDLDATYVVALPISLLIVMAVGPWTMRRTASRAWEQSTTNTARLPQTGTFTEEGVQAGTAVGQGHSTWQAYAGYQRLDDIVVLYQGPQILTIFPRTFFRSQEDWEAFAALVASKLPEGAPAPSRITVPLYLVLVALGSLVSFGTIVAILLAGA